MMENMFMTQQVSEVTFATPASDILFLSGDSYLPYVHDTRGDVALPYIHGGTEQ